MGTALKPRRLVCVATAHARPEPARRLAKRGGAIAERAAVHRKAPTANGAPEATEAVSRTARTGISTIDAATAASADGAGLPTSCCRGSGCSRSCACRGGGGQGATGRGTGAPRCADATLPLERHAAAGCRRGWRWRGLR